MMSGYFDPKEEYNGSSMIVTFSVETAGDGLHFCRPVSPQKAYPSSFFGSTLTQIKRSAGDGENIPLVD